MFVHVGTSELGREILSAENVQQVNTKTMKESHRVNHAVKESIMTKRGKLLKVAARIVLQDNLHPPVGAPSVALAALDNIKIHGEKLAVKIAQSGERNQTMRVHSAASALRGNTKMK